MNEPRSKTIFEYDDYRKFLRDYFTARKEKNSHFSFRLFARIAGFKAHSFVILVLQGKTDLSEGSVDKFLKGLKLHRENSFNQRQTLPRQMKYLQPILCSFTKNFRSALMKLWTMFPFSRGKSLQSPLVLNATRFERSRR